MPVSRISLQSDATSPRLKIMQGEVCDYDMDEEDEDDETPLPVSGTLDITPQLPSTIRALQNRPAPK